MLNILSAMFKATGLCETWIFHGNFGWYYKTYLLTWLAWGHFVLFLDELS